MKAQNDHFSTNDEIIEATAATWLIDSEEGLTPAQVAEFERWKNADPRHAAAFARFSRSANIVSKWPLLADPAFTTERTASASPAPARKWGYPTLLACSGMAAVLAVAIGGWWLQTRTDIGAGKYATANGGYQRAILADGSTIELNADTEVRVQFSESERRVALVRGEAYFTVAKNKSRPFVVATGPLAVTAVGTAFNVKAHDAHVNVMVTEGRVQVARETVSPTPARDLSLVAGDHASISTAPHDLRADIVRVEFESMRDALDWRQPKLVFSSTPLSEVVAQFNLRNQLQISIDDEALAARPVAGTFRADNVAAFVRLLEEQGQVAVERRDHARFILRRPAPTATP